MTNKRRESKRKSWRKWYYLNKSDQNKKIYFNRSKRRLACRAWLDDYKKSISCSECGITNPVVLDFHHEDPDEKDFTLASFSKRTQSIERLKKEIAKCKVLCANCHRIEHAKNGM